MAKRFLLETYQIFEAPKSKAKTNFMKAHNKAHKTYSKLEKLAEKDAERAAEYALEQYDKTIMKARLAYDKAIMKKGK